MIVVAVSIAAVLIEVIVLVIANKKNREMHNYIKAASNIARDMELELMLRNPYAPGTQEQKIPNMRDFICLVQQNTQTKHEYIYSLNDPICVGRARSGNQLILNDSLVSEYHCVIYLEQGNVCLRDMNSANGTVLCTGAFKKLLVANGNSVPLRSGYKLIIGSMVFVVKTITLEEF